MLSGRIDAEIIERIEFLDEDAEIRGTRPYAGRPDFEDLIEMLGEGVEIEDLDP